MNLFQFFLTAKHLKEDVLRGFKIGADDYLQNPLTRKFYLQKLKLFLTESLLPVEIDNEKFEFNFSNFNFNSKLRYLSHKNGTSHKLSPKENNFFVYYC